MGKENPTDKRLRELEEDVKSLSMQVLALMLDVHTLKAQRKLEEMVNNGHTV
jgi:hypothetical protein